MSDTISKKVEYCQKLFDEGKHDEALKILNNIEKRNDINDFERIECLRLKSFIFNDMGLYEEWYKNSTLILQVGERLKSPSLIAFGKAGQLWARHLDGKLPNTIESFRESVSRLEELSLKADFPVPKGGITFQKAWLYYYEGHLDDAIQLFKKLIEINYPGSYLLPLHFLRIGDSYLTKGELGKALKYFEEGISLFKYDSYNVEEFLMV
jgi:tetratricopeptide (TPR) repeat protein